VSSSVRRAEDVENGTEAFRSAAAMWQARRLLLQAVAAAAFLLSAGSAAGIRPPPNCTAAMDGYCAGPALRECAAKIKGMGGELPLKAVRDVSASSTVDAWRCYSPTCLTANGSAYKRGSHCRMGCTRDSELSNILQNCTNPVPPVPGRELRIKPVDIWGTAAHDCGMIRTPELVKMPHKLLLFGQCRHANATDQPTTAPDELVGRLGLRDNMLSVKMMTVESTDGGGSWGNINTVSAIGRSVGVGVYDARAKAVIFQYQSFTQVNPYAGNRLLQRVSTDEGGSWGPERDMTNFLSACNSGPGGQVCGAAGSRLQTSSGRVIFSGHNKATGGGGVCVWYSDDGGETYKTNEGGIFAGNEQSIADLGNGTLYMNGRGTSFPFKGNRASYWSRDDGRTWTAGVEARELKEPNTFGCDGSLIAVPNRVVDSVAESAASAHPPRVFFAEPAGPSERISLRVWCSVDGGESFKAYAGINQGDGAGYSALEYVTGADGTPVVVVVWEGSVDAEGNPASSSTGTMFSHRLTIDDWCPPLK
jgi:hypothetical protein